jgi:hypothetical protein
MEMPPSTHDRRQYPETPMPNVNDGEEENFLEIESEPQSNSLFHNAILILCIGVCIAHLVTIWTLRADVNILLEYQKEQSLQYQHISSMLEAKQQLQWQIVPALK